MTTPNDEEFQRIFQRFNIGDLETRTEVREFVRMDPQLQLVWLFLELKASQRPISMKGLATAVFGSTIAALTAAGAYVANGGKIPGGDK